MTIVVSVGGLAMDWAMDNLTGDYKAWLASPFSQPTLSTIQVEVDGGPPVATGVVHNAYALPPLHVQIMDKVNEATLRPQLLAALDTSESFKALVIADDDGGNERYFMVSFEAIEERNEARGTGRAFVATPVVADKHVRPRSTALSEQNTEITATGQTMGVSVTGDLEVYPIYEIAPLTAKSTNDNWKFRHFIPVRWRSPNGAVRHPTLVSGDNAYDTTPLTPTKAINGTSLGVIVDGVEVERWFAAADTVAGGFDSTNTKIWCNLDFQPGLSATFRDAIGSGDTITQIRVNEDISAFPATGILIDPADGELFAYTGKDNYKRIFTGVSRGIYTVTQSAHSAGDTLEWIQHEIFLVYGPSTAIARPVDDDNKPLLDLLNSNNVTWIWDKATSASSGFGSLFPNNLTRTAGWLATGQASIFTSDQNFTVPSDPHQVAGIRNGTSDNLLIRWQVYIPTGFSAYTIDGDDFLLTGIYNGFGSDIVASADGETWQVLDHTPGSAAGWDDWQEVLSGISNSWRYLGFMSTQPHNASQMTKVNLTLHTDYRIFCTRTAEVSNYELDMTITNQTTGEAITLRVPVGLSLGGELIIDSEAKTVALSSHTRNAYSALERGTLRPQILRLVPGNNTLKFDEVGLTSVFIFLDWTERYYS